MRRCGFWKRRSPGSKERRICDTTRACSRERSSAFIQLSEPELEFLADLQSAPFTLERGKELVREGQVRQAPFILQEGWACSFKMLPDGGRGFAASGSRPNRKSETLSSFRAELIRLARARRGAMEPAIRYAVRSGGVPAASKARVGFETIILPCILHKLFRGYCGQEL